MITRKLLSPGRLAKGKVITFSDHTLLSERTAAPYTCPPHIPGTGIVTMLSGSGRYGINREVSSLDSSRYLLISQDSLFTLQLPHPNVRPLLLFFRADMVKTALARQQADLCWLERVHPMTSRLREQLEWLAQLGNSCSSFSALRADAMIRDILQEFIREAIAADQVSERLPVTRRSTRIELYKRLSATREWILANYPAAISLESMAESAMLNPQHFLRMFRDCYGITPHQFVIDVRLTAARQLLTETKQPVSVICRQTGFDSFSSFSGLFRRRFGSSPTSYRHLTQSVHSSAPLCGYADRALPRAPTSD